MIGDWITIEPPTEPMDTKVDLLCGVLMPDGLVCGQVVAEGKRHCPQHEGTDVAAASDEYWAEYDRKRQAS